jgi:dephospho-CoA kinase
MLRVGLTGGLGSGKSTVAARLRELGAEVIEADELGRAMMQPGRPVYAEIARVFGPEVVNADGPLNRGKLAELAFRGGRLDELNAIVHPAVIAAQKEWMDEVFSRDPSAVAVVESALVFEVERDARARGEKEGVLTDWRRRFDRVVLVTTPDDLKIARYVARINPSGDARAAAEADARMRLSRQIPDAEKAVRADYVIENSGDIAELQAKVDLVWARLTAGSNKSAARGSLK